MNAQQSVTFFEDATHASPSIEGLHHFAWRCKDAEETRRFYEDLLGLPLAHVVALDRIPSTGEYCPYLHLFFEMGNGSYIAFFDLGDKQAPLPSPNTPDWLIHFAMQVPDMHALLAAKVRLEAGGVQVIGPVDHHFVQSIYCFDPNGLRIELTTRTAGAQVLRGYAREAHAALANWTARSRS